MNWKKARKKPVVIEFREVEPKETIYLEGNQGLEVHKFKGEQIKTREGTLTAIVGRDFVIKGVEGEIYPITKTIFYKTYDIVGGKKSV